MKTEHKLNIIQRVMQNRQIVFTIVAVLSVIGIFALYQMPRQEFPDFTVRQGLVIGVYPGATPAQVEEQLTTKVENYIFGFKEVNKEKTYSISRDNSMIMFVEVQDGLNHTDTDAFWAKLRHGLNELKGELPSGVTALYANNDFGDTSAVILTLSSDTKSYKELEKHIKDLESELRKIKAVSKIKHSGLQNEQIGIYINDAKISQYGIKPVTLLAALKTEGAVNYSGEIDNGKIILPVNIPARYNTENDIAEQIVYTDPMGNVIRLKDVAKIEREYGEPDSYITVNGKRAVLITLEMQYGNNIVAFGKDVDRIVGKFSGNIPADISINKIADQPAVVKNSVGSFMKEFLIAIIAVILVTVILLPRKIALIAALTIPVTILITLAVMYVSGIQLDTVTLAALIVVLGMVVDNAIVVIDNHVEKLDQGLSPWDAARESATELFIPVLTATLAIIAVFMPLAFFLTGIAADFIGIFPVTIAMALIISFLIAVLFVPIINNDHIKKGLKKDALAKPAFLDRMQRFYDWTFEKSFRKPGISIIFGIIAIIGSVVLLTVIPRELFPRIERNQFAIEIYLPAGTSLDVTGNVVKRIEAILARDKRVETIAAFVGASSPRFQTLYAPNLPSRNYAQFIVNTKSNKATEEILDEYGKKYRDYFPEAYIRWKQLAMNPTTAPIEVRVSGTDMHDIKETASKVTDIMKGARNVAWVRNDYEGSIRLEPSRQGLSLDVKRDEANRLGFTNTVLSYSLMVGTKGFPLSTVWEGDYPVNIVLHVDKSRKSSYNDLMNQYVSSAFLMSNVQLRQIADIKPEWSSDQVIRRNGVRTITIRADVDRNIYASGILDSIKPKIENIKPPEGVKLEFGGENESEIENYVPMGYALATGIIIIFFILLFQFKRLKPAFLIMSTLLFSLFGACLGLLIMQFPFGFTAFVGIMGLAGLVIRNGIILVDYAEKQRMSGMSSKEAALAAGKRRLRPIFLTSAAASVGVIPMILSKSPLWGPLATTICFGLLFAMVFTLYIVPVLYMYVNRDERG